MNTAEVIDNGIRILLSRLGPVETERFIATINREKVDYTKWRQANLEEPGIHELNEEAKKYASANPMFPENKGNSVL
ncbi:MAG: hypothetical protein ACI4ET_11055 [Bilifractor sp.]